MSQPADAVNLGAFELSVRLKTVDRTKVADDRSVRVVSERLPVDYGREAFSDSPHPDGNSHYQSLQK